MKVGKGRAPWEQCGRGRLGGAHSPGAARQPHHCSVPLCPESATGASKGKGEATEQGQREGGSH